MKQKIIHLVPRTPIEFVKRVLFFLILSLSFSLISCDKSSEIIDNNDPNQEIDNNNNSTSSESLNRDTISCEYYEIKEGVSAIITENGDFCKLHLDSIDNRSIAIFGNVNSKSYNYALIDSLGIIQSILIDGTNYVPLYGKDSIYISSNERIMGTLPYSIFEDVDTNTRVNSLSRSGIGKLLNVFTNMSGLILKPLKTIGINSLLWVLDKAELDGWKRIIDNIDFDRMDIIREIDNFLDYYYFGDGSITTLDPLIKSMCEYRLGCDLSLPNENTPYFKMHKYLDVNYSYSLHFILKEEAIAGKKYESTKDAKNGEIYQDYPDLNLESIYSFEPSIKIAYSEKEFSTLPSIDPYEVSLFNLDGVRTIYGKKKEFYIGIPSFSRGEAHDISSSAAYIDYTFTGVPDRSDMGVKLFGDKSEVKTFPQVAREGLITIPVFDLEPDTGYAFVAYLNYHNKEYQSDIPGYFTTKTPSAVTDDVFYIGENSAEVLCKFYNIDSRMKCGVQLDDKIDYYGFTQEGDQSIYMTDLKALTNYKCKAFVEYNNKRWYGQDRYFSTLPPNIDGVWNVTEGDGESYTVTFQNGECSWSKPMQFAGGYNISSDGTISFGVCIYYIPEQWNTYDNANFTGVVDNLENPNIISGEVVYIHGNWIGAYGEYKKTTFTATR